MVFWFFVIVIAIAVWFLLSPTFKTLGGGLLSVFEKAKAEMSEDPKQENLKRKDSEHEE